MAWRHLARLLVGGLACLCASPVAAAPKFKRRLDPSVDAQPGRGIGPGHVTFVTTDAVYLDRGKRDGLRPGAVLNVTRGLRGVGPCTVTDLSDSSAICTGAGMKPGDRLSVDRRPAALTPAVEPPTSPDELDRRRVAMAAQPWTLASSDAGSAEHSPSMGLSLVLSHEGFLDLGIPTHGFSLERLDVGVSDYAPRPGLTVSVDATALVWSGRPVNARYPSGALALLVREAQVRWRPSSLPLVVRAGRVRPRGTPGLFALDGAQVGWHTPSGNMEAGVFGGLLPTSIGIGLDASSFAAGVYGSARLERGTGHGGLVFQADARAGWTMRPTVHGRFEVGAAAHLWAARLVDAHLLALLSSGNADAPSVVDSLSLDVAGHPTETLRVHLQGRFRGNPLGESQPVGVVFPTSRSAHASLDAAWDALPWLTVSARVGTSREVDGTLAQLWLGPEVGVSQLAGGRLGFSAGYQEELGSIRGRSLFVAGGFAVNSRTRVSARASWAAQSVSSALGASDTGVGAGLDLRLTGWLWTRLSGTWRTNNVRGGESDLGVAQRSLLVLSAQVGADF